MIETDLFDFDFITAKGEASPFLLIVLHGLGDSSVGFHKFQQELNLPQLNLMLLNAPKKYLDGFSWFDEGLHQEAGINIVRQKLFWLVLDLQEQGWELRKIFVLGFSQGCLVGADFCQSFPFPLAGFIGISGYFQFLPRWRSLIHSQALRTPWFITHGTRDRILNFYETEYGVKKLRSAGLQIEFKKSDKGHVFSEQDYEQIHSWILNRMRRPDQTKYLRSDVQLS